VEAQRQQELQYNADYEIQQMNRHVARAQGERSQEESEKLDAEIKIAKEQVEKQEENFRLLNTSNRKLADELEYIKKSIAKVTEERGSLNTTY
jgi:sigma54-dependent transcription regulator